MEIEKRYLNSIVPFLNRSIVDGLHLRVLGGEEIR